MANAETLQKAMDDLKRLTEQFGGVTELVNLSQDLLPRDKFTAQIDGHIVEVSIGMSGRAITMMFVDGVKCKETFNELKQNKQGFFKRIFNIK